ncbi:MAG: nickel-binding protein [Acidimicrobiia bacterium]
MHNVPQGVTPKDVALAHLKDLETQWKRNVRYLRYWFDDNCTKIYCLVDAPSKEDAIAVHAEAHGLMPDEIIPVQSGSIEQLLGSTEEVPPWDEAGAGPPPRESAFRVILFTDIEGSTALTERLGDSGAMEILRAHDDIIRQALRDGRGTQVKHTGDGVMASFTSAVRAVEAAIAIQRAFALQNQEAETPMRVRIGLSAGEPVEENKDLFGTAVQLAARVCASAGPAQILAPNVIRELCAGKGFLFTDQGEQALKGFEEPRRLYEVVWA